LLSPGLRIVTLEAVGTGVLVLGGCGTAVLAGEVVGPIGVALAFGLSLMSMAYTIGPSTGCHINPAVTLGMVLLGRTSTRDACFYVVGQVVGCLSGGLILFVIADGAAGFDAHASGFASNGFGAHSPGKYDLGAVALSEVILTALLVFVVTSTLQKGYAPGVGGIVVGFTLAVIILTSNQVANTSVNPVRSLATAVFQGGWAMGQLWAFIVFPLLGGALGAMGFRLIEPAEGQPPVVSENEAAPSPAVPSSRHSARAGRHSMSGGGQRE
jgi:aquaporin Z